MTFTDPKALELQKKADNVYLDDQIDGIIDLEDMGYEGYSDLQILLEEANYVMYLWTEEGTTHNLELKNARKVIRETNNGTVFKGFLLSSDLKDRMREVEEARSVIAEYERLRNVIKETSNAIRGAEKGIRKV